MPFCPKRLPQPQNLPISDTFLSQHFIFFDNRRKIKSRKTRFVARPPLSHLRWRFAPLRGTQHRCAGASRHPSGALRAQRAARAPFYEHEKKALRITEFTSTFRYFARYTVYIKSFSLYVIPRTQ